ncbi:MAG TPA: glycoside hydrolase family 18 protein [Candidatus Limnocylindrales bacterium]
MSVTAVGARADRAARAARRRSLTAAALSMLLAWSAVLMAPASPAHAAAQGGTQPAAADAAAARSKLSAEVVGYLPYWQMTAETFAAIDLTKLTTIILFSVGWDAAGHLRTDQPGYRAITGDATRDFVRRARGEGVSVTLSFTSFGLTKNAAFFTNPTAQATFVDEAAAFVRANDLDGADLDVEQMAGIHRPAYAAVAGDLAHRLRDHDGDATLSVATNGNVSGARMAAVALAAGADRAFLMGYSYRTAGSSPGSIDPLARRSGDAGLSLSASIELYLQAGVPLGKVILGLPLYGRSWPTLTTALGSPRRTGVPGSGASFTIVGLTKLRATGTILRQDTVPVESSARLVRRVNGVIWQSFYDSPTTLKVKMRFAQSRHLAGVGFWALGYSNRRTPYWSAIGEVFGPPAILGMGIIPAPTNTRQITVALRWRDGAGTTTHVRFASGPNFGSWRPIAIRSAVTLPAGPAVSRRVIRAQIRDDQGYVSTIAVRTVVFDRVRPTMTRLTAAWSTTARAWVIRYAGRDVGSGLAGYRLVLRRDGRYQTLAELRTSTGYLLHLPRSAHFRITVRSVDRATNLSDPLSTTR